MTELARLKFYATQPHSCSYLPDEQATTLFLDPSQPMDVHVYADLSEMGFRRSGDHLYRPIARTATPACRRASRRRASSPTASRSASSNATPT
jgi:arginine-tRNA-protein transferase